MLKKIYYQVGFFLEPIYCVHILEEVKDLKPYNVEDKKGIMVIGKHGKNGKVILNRRIMECNKDATT